MKRHWKTLVVIAAVAAATLSIAAVALGADTAPPVSRGAGGACGALMSDPEAVRAMQDLRAEHQQEMQAWFDKYGADPTSEKAQAALRDLRTEHWKDMKALFDKVGIKAPATGGPGRALRGAGGCGGACGGPASGTSGSRGAGSMMGSGGGMMGNWSY